MKLWGFDRIKSGPLNFSPTMTLFLSYNARQETMSLTITVQTQNINFNTCDSFHLVKVCFCQQGLYFLLRLLDMNYFHKKAAFHLFWSLNGLYTPRLQSKTTCTGHKSYIWNWALNTTNAVVCPSANASQTGHHWPHGDSGRGLKMFLNRGLARWSDHSFPEPSVRSILCWKLLTSSLLWLPVAPFDCRYNLYCSHRESPLKGTL